MEMLDVVDEEGNPTGMVVEREIAHREGIHLMYGSCVGGKVVLRYFYKNAALPKIPIRDATTFPVQGTFWLAPAGYHPHCGN